MQDDQPCANTPAAARAAGEALQRENAAMVEELGLLIDGATDFAIYMLDPEGRVTICNRSAERINGWTEAEVVGDDFAIFYPHEDVVAGKPVADLARANASGRLEEETWQVRKDGSEFLANVTITALRDPAGALRGFGRVVRDVTDQAAANAAIVRREHHLRSILASVPDAMIVFDERGIVSSFSAAAERVFGFTQDEVTGHHLGMLIPELQDRTTVPPDRIMVEEGVSLLVGNPPPGRGLRKNGEVFPIELTAGEASSGGERIFTGFIRDLTKRLDSERRMAELQSELVHVSRVSAMGTMASTLAHEINQPLTAIASYLETSRAMIGSPADALLAEIAQALDLAAAQSLRAGAIVRGLRAFVDGGDTGFRPQRLDALIDEAAGLALLGAHEAGISVTLTLSGGRDQVMVDRIQIQQVLLNLVRNAIQAMARSSRKELTIATARDEHGSVKVTVSDTGPGIDPNIRDRLFDAFATTKEDGMGLGLSICRTIVEAHGGRIWAEAAGAGGTAFNFCVPLMAYD